MLRGEGKAERWALILAGGEGSRLRPLLRKRSDCEIPIQFYPLPGATTLFEETRRRVALLIEPERTLVVVTRRHEPFYAPMVADVAPRRLVVQPENRGSAAAVLYALERLDKVCPKASVAIFPADHYVDDGPRLMRHVDLAFDASAARPELTMLLGIAPNEAASHYGWIETGLPVAVREAACVSRVLRLWENPGTEAARALYRRGCLWNSSVAVARLSTLLGLTKSALPDLCSSFSRVRPALNTVFEESVVRALYELLPAVDFSDQVLAIRPNLLAVLRVAGLRWASMGAPERMLAMLAGRGAPCGPVDKSRPDDLPLLMGPASLLSRKRTSRGTEA
jgi:mannose-1-phosphate guanylyltransferase